MDCAPHKIMVRGPDACPDVRGFGVFLEWVNASDMHIGFVYRIDECPPRTYHLAWHRDVRHESISRVHGWVQASMEDEEDQFAVAASLAALARRDQRNIPYSTVYSGTYFEKDTLKYVRWAPSEGLTCATFVMAVLSTLGLDIIDISTWQDRDGDVEWLASIIDRIEAYPNGDFGIHEHVSAIRQKSPKSRYRPTDVAAAVGSDQCKMPASFHFLQPRAADVFDQMQQFRR